MDGGPPAPTPGRHAERFYEELMGTYSQTGIVQTKRHDQASTTSSARDRPSQELKSVHMTDLLPSAGEQSSGQSI